MWYWGSLAHAAAGAQAALDAVEGELGGPGDVAPLERRDVVHHLDVHGADLGAGVAGHAAEELGVQLVKASPVAR